MHQHVSKREWWTIGLIIVAGVLFRFAYSDRMQVEHFDEGVYASNIWFDADSNFGYPYRHLYAPPLQPFCQELGIAIFGHHWGPHAPALLLGTLVIPVAWWAGRSWFGARVGIAAAVFLALCDMHTLYSRTALTDVPMSTFVFLAVFAAWKSLIWKSAPTNANGNDSQRSKKKRTKKSSPAVGAKPQIEIDYRWAIVAGILTGIAWCAKYNGWLPLAVVISGGIAWSLWERPTGGWRAFALLILLQTVIAGLIFAAIVLPSLPNGYGEVATNHRKYVVGFSGWAGSFQQLFSAQGAFTGGGAVCAFLITPMVAAIAGMKGRWSQIIGSLSPLYTVGFAAATAAIALVCGQLAVLGVLAVVGFAMEFWRQKDFWPKDQIETGKVEQTGQNKMRGLAFWLLLAWFCGLSLATPCYQAYPRLLMPWIVPASIAAALALVHIPQMRGNRAKSRWVVVAAGGICGMALLVIGSDSNRFWNSPAWDDRSAFAKIAPDILKEVTSASDGDPILFVDGEPGLYYHLRSHGASAVPTGDMKTPNFLGDAPFVDIYLVAGANSPEAPAEFVLVGEYPYDASELVWWNERTSDSATVRLYQFQKHKPQNEEPTPTDENE